MTAPEPVDAGHLLPPEAWRAVARGAHLRRTQRTVGRAAVDRTIRARSHGGSMPGGPRLGVLHSAETPLEAGYAYSIAANWFATQASTSATVMIDPAETIRLLPDTTVAYHAGPRVNGFSVGVEQAGYARFARAQWLAPAGSAQMDRVASYLRDCRDAWRLPLRWASDEQIKAAAAGAPAQGWCTHDDVRRVLGGTTHTDPGSLYPRDELMRRANADTPTEPTKEAPVALFDLLRNRDTGACVLAAPGGVWYPVPSPPYLTLLVSRGVCPPTAIDVPANEFGYFRDHVYAAGKPQQAMRAAPPMPLDEAQVLAELDRLGLEVLTDDQLVGAPA